MRIATLVIAFLAVVSLSARQCPAAGDQSGDVLFREDFENDDYAARGWYDGPQIETATDTVKTGKRSCVWHWKQGAILPGGKGGRVHIQPTASVTLSY